MPSSSSRHVQCVLNFADNLEEDGGTVIVPRFHKHVKAWCADNVHLRKQVPFLVFDKPRIRIADIGDIQDVNPVSDSAGDAGSMLNDEIKRLPSRNQKSKNLLRGRGGGGGKGQLKAPISSVDHEAPLLALAHRIPMRQVSSVVQMFKCSDVQTVEFESKGSCRLRCAQTTHVFIPSLHGICTGSKSTSRTIIIIIYDDYNVLNSITISVHCRALY
jgi:hypothetical protein